MEQQHQSPPPYTHTAVDLGRPPAPPDELIHLRAQQHADVTLPDLKTVLSQEYQRSSPQPGGLVVPGSPASVMSGRSLPRIEPYRHANGARSSMDNAIASPSEVGSQMSIDESAKRTASGLSSGLSMEDPEMRSAAEALAGLGNPEFVRSPPNGPGHMPSHASSAGPSEPLHPDEEPMLQLLTERHPMIGGTIGASLHAYTTTKSYTPGFVQGGVNMLERNIATPIISTVGSVGRMTGAEKAARWYLTPSQPRDHDHAEGPGRNKRRRVMDEEMDIESGVLSPRTFGRRDSQDTLPAYRASKPPSYREEVSPAATERSRRPSHNRSVSSQFTLSAAGLSVALSETSRRSLLFCVQLLSRSSQHIATVMGALKLVLEQYDEARDEFHQNHDTSMEKGERPRTPDHDDGARRLAEVIKKHCDEIWQTLKTVVHSVSNAAGGALPSNAREFVRNQLMSLPRRWQMVSQGQNNGQSAGSDTSRNAHRMIAFATEGLDMIGHVSNACQATLESAEAWLSRAGYGRTAEQQHHQHQYQHQYQINGYAGHDEDHEMRDGEESESTLAPPSEKR